MDCKISPSLIPMELQGVSMGGQMEVVGVGVAGSGADFLALSRTDFSYISLLDQKPKSSWPQVNRAIICS